MKTSAPPSRWNRSCLVLLILFASWLSDAAGRAQPSNSAPLAVGAPAPAKAASGTNDPIARIRDEGLNHSRVMETLSYLTEVIGPRLTGSPNLRRANEWSREKLTGWGLTNAHLEAWGPFGRGWSLRRFSAQVTAPQTIPLNGAPRAWSPGFDQPISREVVYLDARTERDLEKFAGKLTNAIVLLGAPRDLAPHFEPLATRLNETNLLRLANAGEPPPQSQFGFRRSDTAGDDGPAGDAPVPGRRLTTSNSPGTNQPAFAPGSTNRPFPFAGRFAAATRNLSFCVREGAALVVTPSQQGDGGTFFVAGATVPGQPERGSNSPSGRFRSTPWATNTPPLPAQVTLANEDYNRLVRMIQLGEKLTMAVDLQVQFNQDDLMAYNTIAEIPGTDLKNQVVMLGGHLDSWHAGTGATDNAAGVAACMEAVRILKALNLAPRRTIRIALWSGEEQGLFGSRAYVAKHFGFYTNITDAPARSALRSPRDRAPEGARARPTGGSGPRKLVKGKGYDKLSVYFNLDNGAGKIRGIHLQGNEAVRPLFRKWLAPFHDLGAETLTLSNTGGTDHTSFDAIGLPGFQFIQDPLDYMPRTHHSNMDVYDRVPPDDLKQAAVVLAAFVYQAAMLDEKLPRKSL